MGMKRNSVADVKKLWTGEMWVVKAVIKDGTVIQTWNKHSLFHPSVEISVERFGLETEEYSEI